MVPLLGQWGGGSKCPRKVGLEFPVDIILVLSIWGPLGPDTAACSEQTDRVLAVAVRAHPPLKLGMDHAEKGPEVCSTASPLQKGPHLSSLI